MKKNKNIYYLLNRFPEFRSGDITFLKKHGLLPIYYEYIRDQKSIDILRVFLQRRIDTIVDMIRLLNSNNIDFIVLKGLSCMEYYPKYILRPSNDLDIYIFQNSIENTENLLEYSGYIRSLQNSHFDEVIVFKSPGNPSIDIELHISLRNFNEEWMRDNSTDYQMDEIGISFKALSKEALFIFLTNHLFYQHFWFEQKLIWWIDLIILSQSLDYENIKYLINTLNEKKPVEYGLFCLYKTRILQHKLIKPSLFFELLFLLTRKLLYKISKKSTPLKVLEELYHLSMISGMKKRISFFFKKRTLY